MHCSGVVLDGVDEGEFSAGVGRGGGGEVDAEAGEGAGSSWGGERVDPDVEFVAVDLEVGGASERFSEEGSGFVVGSGVVGGEE